MNRMSTMSTICLSLTAICLATTSAVAGERKAWQMPPEVLIWARLSARHAVEAGVTWQAPKIDQDTSAADIARQMLRQAPADRLHPPQTGSPK